MRVVICLTWLTSADLFRYGALLSFCAYLLDRASAEQRTEPASSSFQSWLHGRPEISRVLNQRTLD